MALVIRTPTQRTQTALGGPWVVAQEDGTSALAVNTNMLNYRIHSSPDS